MKIDGKAIAQETLDDLAQRVLKLKTKGIVPQLTIILVGDDPASQAYVRQKELKGNEIGAKIAIKHLPVTVTQEQLLKTIKDLNSDHTVHGIIVQQPLPDDIDIPTITKAVEPKKDVDSFHPDSLYPMPLATTILQILEEVFIRCLPAVLQGDTLQKAFRVWLKTKNIVIIGKGETGGGPVIVKLRKMGIEPKIVDSKTPNPKDLTKAADIIVSAVGKPNILTKDMIKRGAVLITVGMSKGKDGKLHGDYDEEQIKDIVSFYTPVPGGVGPVNVAMLLENVVKAAENITI